MRAISSIDGADDDQYTNSVSRLAERVGTLVNTANACAEQGMLDPAIALYADALYVQREAQVEGKKRKRSRAR